MWILNSNMTHDMIDREESTRRERFRDVQAVALTLIVVFGAGFVAGYLAASLAPATVDNTKMTNMLTQAEMDGYEKCMADMEYSQ